jgi:uncharacterized protein (DUF2126 family)
MNAAPASFDASVERHDRAVAASAPPIWIGAEPTFTRRDSESPEWLAEALGGDKDAFARRMAAAWRGQHPGAAVLRTLGRQYPGEPRPRWSFGIYQRRDGTPVWAGPPDPLLAPAPAEGGSLARFHDAVCRHLMARGWRATPFSAGDELTLRVLFRLDGNSPAARPEDEPRLARGSVHSRVIPLSGLADDLAADGSYLAAIGTLPEGTACIELPAFREVADFLGCLEVVAGAASEAALPGLVIQGFPPPVDASVAWNTITPDPAVIEVNQAPYADTASFLAASRQLYALADSVGLSPYRLQYNGTVSDSGGGGQLTLGGPSPEASPFFSAPSLLPRLVRYLNNHPALSYLFAPDYVGSSSQSPRPDEGVRESFNELEVALEQLANSPGPTPDFLWRSLSPFLTDPSGNPHRSELNLEKLWNPFLPGRGCLGLVEFRAFRMSQTPERAAAVAALLRALAAMLTRRDPASRLMHWGDELHDRFALPFYLLQDLDAVFRELEGAGLGLGKAVERQLAEDPGRARWRCEFEGIRFEVEKAVEFWPLVGDVASQESGGSRLVDASTARLQVLLCTASPGALPVDGWRLRVANHLVPLRHEQSPWGPVRVTGMRFREFKPWHGLHPGVEAQGPIRFILWHPEVATALEAELHGWQPQGLAYPGLPADLADAAARRAERFLTRHVAARGLPPAIAPPASAVSPHSVDLRRL